MGMAASQARFLSLVARKNNVEYEGQQINQQRTALSNTSASHYSDLLGMAVPVCPSVEDFTQTVYSFNDGALTNSITSLIAQGDGTYKASYLSSYIDDFAVVMAGATSVVNTATGNYMVGADKLKELGEDLEWAYVLREGFSEYRLTQEGDNYTYTDIFNQPKTLIPATDDVIVAAIGEPPNINDYRTDALVEDYTATGCYSQVLTSSGLTKIFHMEHNLSFIMWADGRDTITYNDENNPNNPKNGLVMTKTNTSNRSVAGYASSTKTPTQNQLDLQEILVKYYPDLYQQLTNLYIDCVLSLDNGDNGSLKKSYYNIEDKDGVIVSGQDASGVNYDFEDSADGASARTDYAQMQDEWLDLWAKVSNVNYSVVYEAELKAWNEKAEPYRGNYVDADDYTKIYSLTERKMFYDGGDAYLKSLSANQLERLYETEVDMKDLLNEKVAESIEGWQVRYVENSATGEWEPIFYNGDDIVNGVADEYSNIRSNIQAYKLGSKQVQNEIKGRNAVLEQDSTGRYINITFVEENGVNRTYALSTSTVTDNDAYNDAMNQYEYDKAIYEQNIEKINAKISIIQSEDKNLELRLKQLDTEHNALSNEMDAVQKVIEKNVESGFKTFG